MFLKIIGGSMDSVLRTYKNYGGVKIFRLVTTTQFFISKMEILLNYSLPRLNSLPSAIAKLG